MRSRRASTGRPREDFTRFHAGDDAPRAAGWPWGRAGGLRRGTDGPAGKLDSRTETVTLNAQAHGRIACRANGALRDQSLEQCQPCSGAARESHHVNGWHVNSFGQTPGIGKNSVRCIIRWADWFSKVLQPSQRKSRTGGRWLWVGLARPQPCFQLARYQQENQMKYTRSLTSELKETT